MSRSSLVLFFLFLIASPALAGSATMNGIKFTYESRLEPPMPVMRLGSGVLVNRTVQRHLWDMSNKTFFGYDVSMDSMVDGRYLFTFAALSMTPQKMEALYPGTHGWRLIPLPSVPAKQVLSEGDTLALDLFVNPSTGQKVVDYLTVERGEGRGLTAPGPARDLMVADVSMELSRPHFSVNGKQVAKSLGTVIAPLPWLYYETSGCFYFSLVPRPDYTRAGEIRGSTMKWRWGQDEFAVNTDGEIAPAHHRAYNLYVAYEPGLPGDVGPPSSDSAGPRFIFGAGPKR
ncbi:MAG TPA: hypothetical protein VER03_08030 [Bryobacteraceae bacterium]|nr:hypothetical protein [Bryobacteraceae bacterium]